MGRTHCALCALTHGALRRRPAWDALVERLPLPVTLLHRNELDPVLQDVVRGRLPCVVLRSTDARRVLLGPEELEGCGTDLGRLERLLHQAITEPDPRSG
jgi:hypothetical protein